MPINKSKCDEGCKRDSNAVRWSAASIGYSTHPHGKRPEPRSTYRYGKQDEGSLTTFEQQLNLLGGRNLIVDNREFALAVLKRLNYYRLTGYLLPYKGMDGGYVIGTAFETVYSVYMFDKRLRNIIIPVLEGIEISFRTKIAYYIAHEFGPLGYFDAVRFSNEEYHKEFINAVNDTISTAVARKEPAIVHHLEKYGGQFPIWVLAEFLSFGLVSLKCIQI